MLQTYNHELWNLRIMFMIYHTPAKTQRHTIVYFSFNMNYQYISLCWSNASEKLNSFCNCQKCIKKINWEWLMFVLLQLLSNKIEAHDDYFLTFYFYKNVGVNLTPKVIEYLYVLFHHMGFPSFSLSAIFDVFCSLVSTIKKTH